MNTNTKKKEFIEKFISTLMAADGKYYPASIKNISQTFVNASALCDWEVDDIISAFESGNDEALGKAIRKSVSLFCEFAAEDEAIDAWYTSQKVAA